MGKTIEEDPETTARKAYIRGICDKMPTYQQMSDNSKASYFNTINSIYRKMNKIQELLLVVQKMI